MSVVTAMEAPWVLLTPLLAIADNHPKYVLTLDPMAGDNTDGIHHRRLPEFLLSDVF